MLNINSKIIPSVHQYHKIPYLPIVSANLYRKNGLFLPDLVTLDFHPLRPKLNLARQIEILKSTPLCP